MGNHSQQKPNKLTSAHQTHKLGFTLFNSSNIKYREPHKFSTENIKKGSKFYIQLIITSYIHH